jgi:rhamnulokinase
VLTETELEGEVPFTAVGSHDTASAVAAVPAADPSFAYISSGTWCLVGVELDRPVLNEESRAAQFTNGRGVDGVILYHPTVMCL